MEPPPVKAKRPMRKKGKRGKAFDVIQREFSRAVKERDNHTCQMADGDCFGILEAHHVKGKARHGELRGDPDNGITLCSFHHAWVHNNGLAFIKFYKEWRKARG